MKYFLIAVLTARLFAQEHVFPKILSDEQQEEQPDYQLNVEESLKIRLEGELWVYLEEEKKKTNLAAIKVERELYEGETVFNLLFEEPDFYRLRFFRQDTPSGTVEERFLTFKVEEESERETGELPSIVPKGEEQIPPFEQENQKLPAETVSQPLSTNSFLETLLEEVEYGDVNLTPASLKHLQEKIKKASQKEQKNLLKAAQFFEKAGSKQNLALALNLYRSYVDSTNNLEEKQRTLYRIYLLQRDFININ